ncbi:hypothetical protein QQS21_007763 [Conoideocrella luteorostrata]|uniref:Vps72/YL1 C-terminal domain-containing protein n=1 Tax=Conoideocrella luteorostrata TaxID=1105319 RepID=A0AAJ0CMV8_9HYPO|nr:hypothetical protein QQS21_007763 [Conoideocrella luteorostrata]
MSDRDTSQLSDPPSDLDSSSDSGSPTQQTEWLATTRKRRSTAGNRMKSILANEEPDSDLELLFAEDENDQGFSDMEEDGSDVQMDSSSSSSEDEDNSNANDLEGEKELERQHKAKRAAQRKRKAQEAVPAKFRKKVRINPTTTASPAPTPRPKKKSERTSWLPSAADLPTRASSRKTTRLSKEQLHQQMAEREARRLKQLVQMEKKAARLEAMKKPPMTQEERLAEAAIVEKRNSKSLNRWEEAEKQREEERKARLAALNQRTLKGPVITFWSGKGQWDDIELRSLRSYVTEVEDKPKKKREKIDKGAAKGKIKIKDGNKEQDGEKADTGNENPKVAETDNGQIEVHIPVGGAGEHRAQRPTKLSPAVNVRSSDVGVTEHNTADKIPTDRENEHLETKTIPEPQPLANKSVSTEGPPTAETQVPSEQQEAKSHSNSNDNSGQSEGLYNTNINMSSTVKAVEGTDQQEAISSQLPTPLPADDESHLTAAIPKSPTSISLPSHSQSGLAAPPPPPPSFLSPLAVPSGLSRLPDPKLSSVLVAPVLAPPPRTDMEDSSPSDISDSYVLATPSVIQLPHLAPGAISVTEHSRVSQSEPAAPQRVIIPMDIDLKTAPSTQFPQNDTAASSKDESQRESTAPKASEPPRDMNATRNGIIYQNFNEFAIRDKTIQTQILFGRKMTKLAKPSQAPTCVITNHMARYQDPKTGLPFHNMHAYKELQRLYHGDYNWSRLVGAWVGNEKQAARGVPERFINPGNGNPKDTSTTNAEQVKHGVRSEQKQKNVPAKKMLGDDGITASPCGATSLEQNAKTGQRANTHDAPQVAAP